MQTCVFVLPVVGVMGSGTEPHPKRSSTLGAWLAMQNVHLLTGGGGGFMAAVCKSFCSVSGRRGLSIGIIPGSPDGRPPAGYPNPWVEIPVYTHLPLSGRNGADPLSRNHINVLTAQVIVALPGSHGTASEVRLAVQYGRPVIAYVDRAEDIPGLSKEVPATPDFEQVKAFVLAQIEKQRG